jgi:hypothetical protein
MQSQSQIQLDDQEFWSDVYGGRSIAIFNHHGCWRVYLDYVLQHGIGFASAEQAIRWLTSRIDQRPSARGLRPGRAASSFSQIHRN